MPVPQPQSLRHRVLLLFVVLAIGPLLTLGILDYAHARRAVERIVEEQTRESASRAAALVAERRELIESDAQLLTENAETQRFFTRAFVGDSAGMRVARAAVDTFLQANWDRVRQAYTAIDVRDARDNQLFRLASDRETSPAGMDYALQDIRRPIRREADGVSIGTLVLYPRLFSVLPAELANFAFGAHGYLLVVKRSTGDVLYDSRNPGLHGGLLSIVGEAAAKQTLASVQPISMQYEERDSTRIASSIPLRATDWAVVSSASLAEFSGTLNAARLRDLSAVIAAGIAIAMLFAWLMGRSTRPLEELTRAAVAVGQGDLTPTLPGRTHDEVGLLTDAFDHMLGRLRTMVREIEVSRQMAVLGEFSAQLSHEIRNPLTSIKLNLQGLAREVQRGSLSEKSGPSIETCVREINRLDKVVKDVLTLSRPRSAKRTRCDLHIIVDGVLALHAAHLTGLGISVARQFEASNSTLDGNEEQIAGLVTNLVVNALEAQPAGGRILVATASSSSQIELTIADDGVGVPVELADRIFKPFVSGKHNGTGLGLAMSLAVARDHGGSIELVNAPASYLGAAFRVTLPTV